ncbi:RagB/SusD family nutrient uptake outer membrane protein [Parapedobacter sp.]
MKKIIILIFAAGILAACDEEFLDEKPVKSIVVPQSLADFRALLDNNTVFYSSPTLGQIASDEFELTDAGFVGLGAAHERNAYIWNETIFESNAANHDWTRPYQQIFYSNVVLDGLAKLAPDIQGDEEWAQLKGSALFFRTWAYFHLSQLFCPPYRRETAETELGLPLREHADVNVIADRSSLEETYARMIGDLKIAAGLLPERSDFTSRPTKCAAYGLLARIYLSMGDYPNAGLHADSALAFNNVLLDYNTIDTGAARPFIRPLRTGDNPEVIFYDDLLYYYYMLSSQLTVNEGLFGLYDENDLRKDIFFRNDGSFKGTYSGASNWFNGLTTAELYLISAESHARAGNVEKANTLIGMLQANRWVRGTYEAEAIGDAQTLLLSILEERRRELVARGRRWGDLRRLNMEPELQTTLHRTVQGRGYTLLPGSNRYTFPIPPSEVDYSDISQNVRD